MNIDWSQLITKAMKDAAVSALHMAEVRAVLAAKNVFAAAQINRIQDRFDTLGYGIAAGDATELDEAEQAELLLSLKAWKGYKFTLGKVTSQSSWPATPVWPVEPIVPAIFAEPVP